MQIKAERYNNRIRSIARACTLHYTSDKRARISYTCIASLASPSRALYFVEITDFVVRVHSACIVFNFAYNFYLLLFISLLTNKVLTSSKKPLMGIILPNNAIVVLFNLFLSS